MVVSQGEAFFVLAIGAVPRLCMVSPRPFGADFGAYMRPGATVDYFEIVSLFPNVTEPPNAGSCLVYPEPR